jgi:hypothetical protein
VRWRARARELLLDAREPLRVSEALLLRDARGIEQRGVCIDRRVVRRALVRVRDGGERDGVPRVDMLRCLSLNQTSPQ